MTTDSYDTWLLWAIDRLRWCKLLGNRNPGLDWLGSPIRMGPNCRPGKNCQNTVPGAPGCWMSEYVMRYHSIDTEICVYQVCFSSSKIRKNSFSAGPRWGNLRRFPRPPSRLERGTPPLHSLPPSTPSASRSRRPSVVWPPSSLKFVHLALRSKRLDTPDLYISSISNFIFKFHIVPDPYFHIYLHIPAPIHTY